MIRKFFILSVYILFSISAMAQKIIQMQKDNGVFKISCSVNGAKMKMIFDTGASSVSLSESTANFLYDNDYISKEDILGSGKVQTADGTIHDNVVINIKDIDISGIHLKNVEAVVLSSQNAPLLLGQTAIQKLGHISLNGDKLIVNDYVGDYSDEELDKIYTKAKEDFKNRNYYASLEGFKKVFDYREMSTYSYYMIMRCLVLTKQYDEAIKYGKKWEIKCRDEEPDQYSCDVMYSIGMSYSYKLDTNNAILYFEKTISLATKLGLNPGQGYIQIALCYMDCKDYSESIKYHKKALKCFFEKYNTSEKEISSKGINNKDIGGCLYTYAKSLYNVGDESSGNYIMELSAKCNCQDAIDYLFKYNIRNKSKPRRKLFE